MHGEMVNIPYFYSNFNHFTLGSVYNGISAQDWTQNRGTTVVNATLLQETNLSTMDPWGLPLSFQAAPKVGRITRRKFGATDITDPERDHEDDHIGLISNNYRDLRNATVRAGLASKKPHGDSDYPSDKKSDNAALDQIAEAIMLEDAARSLAERLEDDIETAAAERKALLDHKLAQRGTMAALSLEIAEQESDTEKLRLKKERLSESLEEDRRRLGYEDGGAIHEELDKVREKNRKKFGIDEDREDYALRQEAWDENNDDLRDQYARKGLGDEFDILERHRNGEPVDPAKLAEAQEKARDKGLSADLDIAMYRRDRGNAFFKTETGLMVRLQNNQEILIMADRKLQKTESNLNAQIKKLEELRAEKSNLESDRKETETRIGKIDELIARKKEQLKRAGDLEAKLQNPDFRKTFDHGDVDQNDLNDLHKEYKALQNDVRETDMAYHKGNPDDLLTDPSNRYHARTSRSAAGPAGAMAERDGASKNAFSPASSPEDAAPAIAPQPPRRKPAPEALAL
jgi:hypothetical protein